MTNRQLVDWYVYALTGDVNAVIDWRCIHDQDKALAAHNYRGTVNECWATLCDYNARGYGIFSSINALNGEPTERKTLDHVAYIRAHVVDLDNTLTAAANYERAVAAGGSFAVQSSPGKFHIYWRVQPYVGNDFFTLQQRKLAQLYDGDRKIIDATRVMRVPGFLHQKGAPAMVNAWQLPAFDHIRTADALASELAHVNVVDFTSARSPLGTPEMAAPSMQWLQFAMTLIDPNDLDRGEWLSLSAAFKQAGWTISDPDTLYNLWSAWCARYKGNEPGENLKLWESIRDTEVGWTSIKRRAPTVEAYMTFGFKDAPPPRQAPGVSVEPPAPLTIPNQAPGAGGLSIPKTDPADQFGEILSEHECKAWFKDCYFVQQSGKIFTDGRFMNATQFNGKYGGKNFIISSTGKITDEAWKAATRSTCWTIPKVDHIRFLPDRPSFEILEDELGRPGLNTYLPARIDAVAGDVAPFFDWLNRILPDKGDQEILLRYMAHCIKFPGHKIPWAPMLQSCEGIGKTIFREVMQQSLGIMYVYSPKAPELVKSGSTFNAWMRGKLMIMVDEIKIDERRELIEILKPMITDARVEIQGKGVDQDMEDNTANWLFFSNYKDAIPINKNGRRYAIFYSVLQSLEDMLAAGMDDEYFKGLWSWLRAGGGLRHMAHWFLNHPVQKGDIWVRAPKTSSYNEALERTQSPLERVIVECVADGVTGFRGGYISALAVAGRAKVAGIRSPSALTIQTCLENLGYVSLGRSVRAYIQEDASTRAEIYGSSSGLPIEGYGRAQGYE